VKHAIAVSAAAASVDASQAPAPRAKAKATKLNFWYGQFHALRDVSMTVTSTR